MNQILGYLIQQVCPAKTGDVSISQASGIYE